MSEPLLSPTAATYVKSYGGADSPRTAKGPPFAASPQDASPRFRVYKVSPWRLQILKRVQILPTFTLSS